MKVIKRVIYLFALSFALLGCATTTTLENEEIVEYRKIESSKFQNSLTQEQIDEDCEMLKYYFYNGYAGYEEAVEFGFDMDSLINKIKTNMKSNGKNAKGLYSSLDFRKEIYKAFSSELKIPDQHISISGSNLKDTVKVFYSDIYLEEKSDGYYVKKSENEKIKEGQRFTGNENNLFKIITQEGEQLYRYGLLTKQRIKSANISVDGETILIPVKDDEPIAQKNAWNGLKETKDTLYMSLSDCYDVAGLNDKSQYTEAVFREYLKKLSVAVQGKKNIIFDLRSNTGGYSEFPARMLSAVYYNQHTDEEFQNNALTFFENSIRTDNEILFSPTYLQILYPIYEKSWKNNFALFTEENQKLYKDYYKKLEYKSVRVRIDARVYKSDFTEFPQPDFQGNVYILTNCRTASAAELGTAMAFYLKDKGINVKIIGENTWGAVKYVGMMTYFLPNSGTSMYIGSRIGLAPVFNEIPEFKGEGVGFYPDYWATNDTILSTLVQVLEDEELTEVLAGLDKNML